MAVIVKQCTFYGVHGLLNAVRMEPPASNICKPASEASLVSSMIPLKANAHAQVWTWNFWQWLCTMIYSTRPRFSEARVVSTGINNFWLELPPWGTYMG